VRHHGNLEEVEQRHHEEVVVDSHPAAEGVGSNHVVASDVPGLEGQMGTFAVRGEVLLLQLVGAAGVLLGEGSAVEGR